MKFRKYLLLILCFCTSLSVSALNYQSIKDILEKLNRYSETISWINIVGHILWIPFEMLLIGPLNIIICETGVNNCIKYSTLAIKSWYKRMKTDEIKSQGNFHFNMEYYFGFLSGNYYFFSDLKGCINFGQELVDLAKYTCESVAVPLFIQIVICLIQGTISFYAVFSILIRFTSITTKLLAASIGMLFSVRVLISRKKFNQ